MSKHQKKTGPRFVQLFHWEMDNAAYRDLSALGAGHLLGNKASLQRLKQRFYRLLCATGGRRIWCQQVNDSKGIHRVADARIPVCRATRRLSLENRRYWFASQARKRVATDRLP